MKLKFQIFLLCLMISAASFDNSNFKKFTAEKSLLIEVNESITNDYIMDETRKLVNVSLDHSFYIEDYESMESQFSQTIINQLRKFDRTNLLDRYANESMAEHLSDGSFAFAKVPRGQNLIKIDNPLHWPIKKESVVEGHVILGGLMMVHEREDNMTCGPIMPQGGIQALEAMLFTLDKINEMKLLNNITIGAHILDDCDKDTYGLEMAVDFIRGKLKNELFKLSRYD